MSAALPKRNPPVPPGHWLWGHTKMVYKDPLKFPVDAALNYKPICRIRLMGMRLYVTANLDCIKDIFLNKTDSFVKGPAFKMLTLITGNGLLTSEGEFWKSQRRLAQPAFHKEKLKAVLQTFIDCSKDLALKWNSYDPKDVHHVSLEMGELSLRITGKTLFGIDLFAEAASLPPDVKDASRFINDRIIRVPRFPINWPLPSHRNFLAIRERLNKVVYKIIDERIAGATSGNDLLQAFLDATDADTGNKMTREQLRDEVVTLFLAGFETTSVAISWVWYVLHQNPDIKDKLKKELEAVVGDGEVKPEHIMQLPYAKAVMEETLRLYPPAYYIQRQAIKDIEMQGYELKKGSLILASVYGLHKNPDYWEEPEQFKPERFLSKNGEKVLKAAYMPFGMGQRICIGNQFALLEMISVMAVLARQFNLTPKEGYVPEMTPAVTTNISEGMPMHIEKV